MPDYAGQRVTVMGLGRFGGGVGVVRFLAARGARVTVTDKDPPDKLAGSIAQIEPLVRAGVVSLALGGHLERDFTSADLVVANPAVPTPWSDPYLAAAAARRVPVTTEILLLLGELPDDARARTVAITGTAGKSTTTAMIAHALAGASLRVAVGGNIGGSLLAHPEATAAPALIVLELSSAMLHWIGQAGGWSPRVAVVTNFSDNHADWHGSIDHYRASKQRILAGQRAGDTAILGPGAQDWPTPPGVTRTLSRDHPYPGPLVVPGAHNRANAHQALLAASALAPDAPPAALAHALAGFPGLDHRLALVARRGSQRFFNDSKCTTPDACLRALSALARPDNGSTAHVHLIVGGYDKRSDLSGVAQLAAVTAGLYCVGHTGPAIHAAAAALAPGRSFLAGDLACAVRLATERMAGDHDLLLSPACASWDQYEHFERRGEHFQRLVLSLPGAQGPAARPSTGPAS
ncbi:MAG: hypothetical protein C0513_00055 [Isosphaera sp.]|nr:hypothetical protein [Isosphaera sp.]